MSLTEEDSSVGNMRRATQHIFTQRVMYVENVSMELKDFSYI